MAVHFLKKYPLDDLEWSYLHWTAAAFWILSPQIAAFLLYSEFLIFAIDKTCDFLKEEMILLTNTCCLD